MKAGVSITPCGVSSRPRRAPVGSVFKTSKRKDTLRVYQANAAVHATLTPIKIIQSTIQTVRARLNDIFLGLAVENPRASSRMDQILKRSIEPSSVASHFGASLERNAPGFDASRFSRSTISGGLRTITTIASRYASRNGTQAYATMLIQVLNLIALPRSD